MRYRPVKGITRHGQVRAVHRMHVHQTLGQIRRDWISQGLYTAIILKRQGKYTVVTETDALECPTLDAAVMATMLTL